MSLAGKMGEIAAAVAQLQTVIPGLQVVPFLNTNPTPPSVDVFPGDPFQDGAGFGSGNNQVFFTVRARVSTADQEAGQELLLRMLDPDDAASVEVAILEFVRDSAITPEGVSGFREYLEDVSEHGRLLGCEWRVSVFL